MSLTISKFVSQGLDSLLPGTPVVLVLHGYGANERDLASLMSFLPEHPWAALRAPLALSQDSFAWCGPSSPLTPSADELKLAGDAIWDWVEQCIPADSPLVVLGFSQGGLMATQMLRTRPARLVATVILAGFLHEGEQPADAQLELDRPKVFYGRGAEDQRIPREAISALNTWLQLHTRAQTKTYEGLGHSIDARVMNDVASYVSAQLS
jgi:phospholipase/carboxylesterase